MKWIISIGASLTLLLPFSVSAAQMQLLSTGYAAIRHAMPTTNYGREMLEVGARTNEYQTYIKFNVTGNIPRGSTINRAYLKLYAWGDGCFHAQSMDVKAVRVARSWDEGTITWNNSPDSTTTGMSTHTIPMRDDTRYEIWDVTNIVKAWVEQGVPEYGFKLYYYNGDIDCEVSFFSRETQSSLQKPYLAIDYSSNIRIRDILAPRISNVSVEHLSTIAVDVKWNTDEPATGLVEFGQNGQYDRSSTPNTSYRTSHIARVEGLQQGTTYNYRITSVDAAGNKAVLDNQSFTTYRDGSQPHASPSSRAATPSSSAGSGGSQSGGQPREQLHLQNIISDVTGATTANIKWWSFPTGTSWVFVSSTADANDPISAYGEPQGRNDDVETHRVSLVGLSPNTTYGFRVATRTSDNQWAVSDRQEFKTYAQQGGVPNQNGQNGPTGETPLPDQFETEPGTDVVEAGTVSSDAAGVKNAVAEFLGENGNDSDSKDANKNKDVKYGGKSPSLLITILWYVMRLIGPLFVLLCIIIFIIFWKRRKKEDKTKVVKSKTGETKSAENKKDEITTKENDQMKNSNKKIWIIIIVIVILFLIWKIISSGPIWRL